MYEPSADWDIIRQVKEAVQVPVMGNGDVTNAQEAARMLQETGCDLVMVGRGALGNPWIFQQINAYLTNSCCIIRAGALRAPDRHGKAYGTDVPI